MKEYEFSLVLLSRRKENSPPMISSTRHWTTWALLLGILLPAAVIDALEPIPDRLVVLTFDDSVASHHSVVRPVLKRFGFNATFFITEGFSFRTNKQDYMTWDQIADLHRDGFEIGNHTRDHWSVNPDTLGRLREQVEAIDARCAEHGIPKPISFGYPGNAIAPAALPLLRQLGFLWARRGGAPEHSYEWGRGFAYEPGRDHPLLIPSAGDARPDWTMADFLRAVDQARDGRIAVLQFHGVPDRDHPWVHMDPVLFNQCMSHLKTQGFTVVALRDLSRYVDPSVAPLQPMEIIERRKQTRTEVRFDGRILSGDTGELIPARLYVRDAAGGWWFAKSSSMTEPAIRYERKSSFSADSVEMHVTVPARPFRLELPPGRYEVSVEKGKEWHPLIQEIDVKPGMSAVDLRLRRWSDVAREGWYSGDVHNHRNPADLPNVMRAEDLNVALPMVDWTTVDTVAPAVSGRGFPGAYGNEPVYVDALHVWHPRNTEYEIFTTAGRSHTLGAFLVLNHRARFDRPVFPLAEVVRQARVDGALIDLEKHNWPWSIAMVPLLGVDLFELANNHHWRTDFGVRNWADPAPPWMKLPGSGNGIDTELAWTHYGFETYYALLNCGFNLRPSAGTANGVHPVPLGFSRVYVKVDGGFSYDRWMRGLAAGRSFVTTGPMLLATVNQQSPGEAFRMEQGAVIRLDGEILSEQPLESIEWIRNGQVWRRIEPGNEQTPSGAYRTRLRGDMAAEGSGWLALRCFERRAGSRFRFAHTAPWRIEVPGSELLPRREQVDWLVSRVESEIVRSRSLLPSVALAEYEKSLEAYRKIAAKVR